MSMRSSHQRWKNPARHFLAACIDGCCLGDCYVCWQLSLATHKAGILWIRHGPSALHILPATLFCYLYGPFSCSLQWHAML